MDLPILYSFRRCPYAIRARMALALNGIDVELREVVLKDKPKALIELSPKATVPVMLLPSGKVLDESREIMTWAAQNSRLFVSGEYACKPEMESLINQNDDEFKYYLDRYKYADRYPEKNAIEYRDLASEFLVVLEKHLQKYHYLFSDEIAYADIAIMPFVRQFSMVDKTWFDTSEYSALKTWLQEFLGSPIFISVMQKYPQWRETSTNINRVV